MIDVVILHGASAVGKTYLMNKIVAEEQDLLGWEMDDCRYWLDYLPALASFDMETVDSLGGANSLSEFYTAYQRGPMNRRRCTDYLVAKLHHLLEGSPDYAEQIILSVNAVPLSQPSGLEALYRWLASHACENPHPSLPKVQQTIVMTVGALPSPSPPGNPSIYSWLSKRLPVTFCHILIEIPEERHIEQIKRRGRLHLKDEILANNSLRLSSKDTHDIVLSSYEQLRNVMDRRRSRARPSDHRVKTNGMENAMKLRIHSSNNNPLRYVQIFGERNSGTNHLKALVSSYMNDPNDFLGSYPSKKNPENTTRMFGYKHYYAKDGKVLRREQAETLFLVLYKNPYTWIRSTMEKPYHFRENLQDRSIVDLPQILLTGTNVRGEPIPDVDPLTGDSINIFDLRRFKIANWEALSTKVDNVVYINYEMLLMYPKDIVQSILAGFQGLFRTAVADDHEPDARYVQKYVNPLPFTSDEMAVMDSHIDWATEARVGYERGNLFI